MKIKHLLIGMLAMAAAVACKQDEPVEEPKLEVNKTAVALAATAAEGAFEVTANNAWSADVDADWVSLEPANGAGGEKAVTVKVTAEDNTAEARTATVTVKSGKLTKTVKVAQAAAAVTPGPGDEPGPDAPTYILVGEAVGGWDVDKNGVVLTLKEGYYEAKGIAVTGKKGMHFTKNNKWEGNVKGLHGLIAPNEIGEVGNNDISLTEDGLYDVYLTEALDKFYFMTEGKLPSEAVEHKEISTVWGVCGSIEGNSWGNGSDPEMTLEDEWYVAKNITFTEVNLKIRGNNSWADDLKWGTATKNQTCELNKAVAVSTCTEFKAANPSETDNPNVYIAAPAGAYDVYFSPEKKEVWVMTPGYKPGDETPTPVEPVTEGDIWENDGTVGAATWSASPYRFSIEGGDALNECCAEIPAAVWEGMKIAPFCVNVKPATAETEWWQIRVLDGWWTKNDESGASDINPQSAGLVNNGDGTYTFQVDLASNPDLLALIDTQHLLFAGDGFIINKMYFGDLPTPAVPVDVDIDGKQWVFTWEAMGAPFVIDLGVTEPGVAILAYDMAALDPEYAGIYFPYMIGTYEITKTDGTSGVVTFTDIDYGETINIPYSNATENSVHFESEALLEENVDCTLATTKIEISMESAEYLEDGEYWIIADGKVATPLTSNYGYLQVTDAIDGKSYAANAFTFTQVEEGVYTIQDANGKYYYQTGSFNSFNVSATDGGTDEYLWEVYDTGNGQYAIINYETGKYIQLDSQYGTYGCYMEEKGAMPTLVLADEPIEEPEAPAEYTSNVKWTLGDKAYAEKATINGNANVDVLKLGTSDVVGTAKITIPAGTTKVSFYGVAWNGKSGKLTASVGGTQVYEQALASNAGASNKSPYTITVADTDYYEMALPAPCEADTVVDLSTVSGATRVILWGIKAHAE